MIEDSTSQPLSQIHLLPEHIIDQIKAGEVIERPATLIKELLENSIDAGATKISVHIINNGLDLISVEDNGTGIHFEDLPLAFCRHATSKLTRFDDLYHLYTYGFRGEALASMASVSKITCISNKKGHKGGTIKFHGGEQISHIQNDSIPENMGTGIFVKDLFYNTPVRMKFMQSQTTEKNHLKKMINAFLLTHPEVEFSIKWDDQTKQIFPIVTKEKLEQRVKKIFEKKKEPLSLTSFANDYDGSKVELILSLNSSRGPAGKFQYLFINDRYVQDTQIHKVILNSAQNLWPLGETGNYIAFIYLNPEELDVNVHPNKTVIKLFQPGKIFSLISSTIKKFTPKSEHIHPSSPQTSPDFFNLDSETKAFKDIQYREQDFTSENSLQNYFSHLDQKPAEVDQSISEVLYKDKDAILYKNENLLYLIHNQRLNHFYIDYLLNSNQDKTSIPLLVSTPLSLDFKFSDKRVTLLNKEGFEIDYIDKKSLVVRAFPKSMSHLPHEKIIIFLLNEKLTQFDKKWSISQEIQFDFILNESILLNLATKFSIALLNEKKILKQISGKELIKIL